MPKVLIYNADIGWVDVSSWVVRCSDVPIVMRNRDWSPIFNGIKISISNKAIADAEAFTPVKGAEVLVQWEGDDHFLGYIKHFVFDYDNYTWDIEVNHFLMKLEDYRIRITDLQSDLMQGAVDWDNGKEFSINLLGHYCECTGHDLSEGDKVLVTSDGILPDPLIENHFYYVALRNSDSFYLFKDFAHYRSCMDIGGGDPSFDNTNKIIFTDTGTGNPSLVKNTNLDLYDDCAFYRDIPISAVNVSGDQIVLPSPYNTIPPDPNDYYGYPWFTLIMFHSESSYDLPSPLNETQSYIAVKYPTDAGIVLYETMADYLSNSRLDITDDGDVGHQWCTFIMRLGTFADEDSDRHNVNYDTPFVQLKHLVQIIFAKIGITLDTTAIDSIVYHRFVTTEWTWSEVYLMETMLYNLNQQAPIKPEVLETKPLDAQITYLQFIQDIFGKLGIGMKYTGNYTYELVSQKRDVDSFITPNNEDYFVIPDDNKIGFKQETIEASGGWIHSRFLAALNGWGYKYDDSDRRTNKDGVIADDAHYSSDTQEYNSNRSAISRVGAGINDIEWYNHLFLFLKRKHYSGNNFVEDDPMPRLELYDFSNAGDIYSIIQNQQNSFVKDFTVEDIECRAGYLSQEIWSVKEINLDIAKRRIKITQEKTTS